MCATGFNPRREAAPAGRDWHGLPAIPQRLPVIAEEAQLDPAQLTFIDYLQLVTNWLKLHR
jgi:hypothetical protein